MEGRRIALLVATDHYQDSGLSRLAAPSADASQLAAVLGDPVIAGFEVTQLHNRPNAEVGRAIGNFYRNRRRDDLTLLYFTGHGIKDDYGQLYLAMTDTDRDNLHFTGLRGEQIRLARLDEATGGACDPIEGLKIGLRAYVDFGLANPHHYQLILMSHTEMHDDPTIYLREGSPATAACASATTAACTFAHSAGLFLTKSGASADWGMRWRNRHDPRGWTGSEV